MYNVIYDFAEQKPANPILAQDPHYKVEHTTTDKQEERPVERSGETRKAKWNSIDEMLEQLFREFEVEDESV